MAKKEEAVSTEQTPVTVVTYRDKVFTSRTLILPDARTLAVAKGIATAQADDTVALEYLRAHPDLEPLE